MGPGSLLSRYSADNWHNVCQSHIDRTGTYDLFSTLLNRKGNSIATGTVYTIMSVENCSYLSLKLTELWIYVFKLYFSIEIVYIFFRRNKIKDIHWKILLFVIRKLLITILMHTLPVYLKHKLWPSPWENNAHSMLAVAVLFLHRNICIDHTIKTVDVKIDC